MNLINRNFTGELIAFVKMGNEQFYCIAPTEIWVGDYWNSYVDLNKGSLESQYFEFLKEFKIDYYELVSGYSDLISLNSEAYLNGNKPFLFIDFSQKHFVSFFYEQLLEDNVPEGWIGEFKEVVDLIPEKFRYWGDTKLP